MSRIRLLGTLALVLVCAAGALVLIGLQPAARSAGDLAGDHWFRITLNDQQIGYMHSTIDRDWRGRWRFATDLRFVLRPGQPVRIRQQLEFGALPPFPLLHGEQRTERGGTIADAAELVRQGDGYAWRRSAATGAEPRVEPVDWRFGLADYLAFEAWLRETTPAPGSTVTLPSLDFGRRQLVPKRYRILAHTADGYEIENPAPHEATRVTLDGRLQPTHMTLAGLFDLERVPKAIALAPRTALQAASYHVPVDRPLADHTRIRRLVLGVEGSLDAARVWPELTDPSGAVLNLGAGTPSGLPRTGEELAATDAHPVDDARIRRLARDAVAEVEGTAAQALALTRFVHGFVRYEADARSRHVLALLDDPAGDCSEYADLLTTLARSLGIPARTVFGLAYADETPPAFRFHAWNELSVDGRWIVVDPTWNQTEVDATHIPMPLDVATALQLLTGGGNLRFVVRDVGY